MGHISVTLTIMMKFTPETRQSDSNSSNANFSVSLAVMPIVRSFLQRSVTNYIKLSHLQKSSPIRGSLGFKRFHSSISAPALTNVQLKRWPLIDNKKMLDRADAIDNKKMLDRADAIDNKKMYTRLVSLLLGKQYCAERVINRVSDADFEAEVAVYTAKRKEHLNLIAALSRAGNLDITKCIWDELDFYSLDDERFPAGEQNFKDLVVLRNWRDRNISNKSKATNNMLVADVIDDLNNLNREKRFKDLVAEINDMKAPNNMLVNAGAIDNFKKLDRADAIYKWNEHVMGLISCDRHFSARVINRVSDADWEAETADLAAICKEVLNLTVAKSLKENLDITNCSWNSLNDYFPMISNEFGIYEEDFNDLVAEINDC